MGSRKFLTNEGFNEKVKHNFIVESIMINNLLARVTATKVTAMDPSATEILTMADTTTMVVAGDTTGVITTSQL